MNVFKKGMVTLVRIHFLLSVVVAQAMHDDRGKGRIRVLGARLESKEKRVEVQRELEISLLVAAREGHDEWTRLLLDQQADVEAKNAAGQTPLIIASTCGKNEVVQLLLARGANKDAIDSCGDCSLISAISGGHAKVVLSLLESKIDVNKYIDLPEGRHYPLECAVIEGGASSVEVVKILLDSKAKADPRKRSCRNTPLTRAAAGNCVEIMKVLLEAKADVNAVDSTGVNSLMIAVTREYTEIVPYLICYGSDSSHIIIELDAKISVAEKGISAAAEIIEQLGVIDGGGRQVVHGFLAIEDDRRSVPVSMPTELEKLQRMQGIIAASCVVRNIMTDHDWPSEQLLQVLMANTNLPIDVGRLVDNYASHMTSYPEVNSMVQDLIARNQKKHLLSARLARRSPRRGLWLQSAAQCVSRTYGELKDFFRKNEYR